jgi:tetratricopeptide (TPR) repeat protein
MVNSDGKFTMLGQWRIVLRQAEESARAGRFDEALTLANRPDVADHRQAVLLRNRLALDLVARAERRAKADDLAGALEDLALAERFGAAPDTLAAARYSLADRVADDVRIDLDAGEPGRVVERCDALAKHRVGGPALRRLREAAEAWQTALEESRKGEYGRAQDALDRAERMAGESAKPALAMARRDLEARQSSAHQKVERLYTALPTNRWGEILAAAEAVLETVPDHPAARQARSKAWQQIGAISPTATLPQRSPTRPFVPTLIITDDTEAPRPVEQPVGRPWANSPANRPPYAAPAAAAAAHSPRVDNPGPQGRFLLWADTIGGFLVCLENEVVLGRAGPDSLADIPVLGDLSRSHATIVRDGDGYVIRAHHTTFLNGRKVEMAPLRNGDVIRLGSSVELEFHQPSPVSSTARLEIVSRHRLPIAVDGVILMSENCIIGPSNHAHVPAPMLRSQVVIHRQGAGLACRAPGAFEVDSRPCVARAPITLQSSILGEGFSFSLEPLASRSSQV